MTEKEKMLAGELYSPLDEELTSDRARIKDLCHKYNLLLPSDTKEKQLLLREILGKVSDNPFITAPFWCDYGYNIEIGKNFYANHNLVILDCAKVIFGDNILIAPNCGFYTAGHPIDRHNRNQGLEYAYPIVVGDDVWFGGGVQVLPGVTIGNNVVIGAGSVITRDIPGGVVAAGNPCRVLRKIE